MSTNNNAEGTFTDSNNEKKDNEIEASNKSQSFSREKTKGDNDSCDVLITRKKENYEEEINCQRHYFDGYNNDDDETEDEDYDDDQGGFVTFLNTARWSETRTLFLPFVPVKVVDLSSHDIERQRKNGVTTKSMELLWIIGEYETLLVRMDDLTTGPIAVPTGDATSYLIALAFQY